MEFDYQQVSMVGGIIALPDYPFSMKPLQPAEVKETIVLCATNTRTRLSIAGTADQREKACGK